MYSLLRVARGADFENGHTQKSAGTTRLGTGSQVFNYNAKIYTDQTTPPAGTYLDNVILDVGF